MGIIDDVRVGMRVFDSTGEELGTVDELKAGDPAAATADGQDMSEGGLLGNLADIFGGADLGPQAAARLLRIGYIRIDRKGFLGGHGYADADRIEGIDGDTVRLAITADELLGG